MSKEFPAVPLGEILTSISRPEIVEPDKIYQILGAHWYAEGLYIKETKPGSEIQADKVYRIEQGDFVYNRLFAWKGSFAVATAKDDNCYVSNEFPAFTIDHRKVNAQYLRRYFCRASVWEEALGLSSGGTPTSRNRLKEDKLLSMRIPLPTPEEQQRIVARIEELVTKIEKARGLHNQVDSPESIYASTVASIIESHRNAWQKCKVSNVILSIDSGWSPQCLDQPVTGDLWGVLKTTAVQWGEFRSSENKAIPEFLDPKPELCVRSGDV